MKLKVNIDTRNFTAAIQELAKKSGVSIPRVVEYEARKVLEAAIKYTPAASVAKIRATVEKRVAGEHKTSYIPKTPFRGRLSKGGGKTYFYSNRYPAPLWSEINAQRKASLQEKLGKRGLSKASWSALAREAGLGDAGVPAYARKALSRYNYPGNASAKRIGGSGGRFSMHFRNSQPTVQSRHVRGIAALRRAIRGREKYFQRNLQKGVLDDMSKIARAYPGLTVAS